MNGMNPGDRVLVVEDDPALGALIAEELESNGLAVVHVETLADAATSMTKQPPQLIITDLRLPDGDGASLLQRGKEQEGPGIIVITAFGTVRQAVAALKAGADDFLTKPLDLDHLMLSVGRVLQSRRLRADLQRLTAQERFHGMIGNSNAMQRVYEQVRVVARGSGAVLITGESGSGKELVARAIHEESERRSRPFLVVNCAGIPAELLESEFFGHAAGAFTGARRARRGLFQEADGGTLLLDEIAEMPMTLQAKLLRALQDGHVRPVGQEQEEQVDVRILAATHRDLAARVAEGSFREDLFFRLETFTLSIPSLRERGDDLLLLAHHFLRHYALALEQRVDGFDDEAVALLQGYPFPGNVRELQNVVERAVTFCRERLIRASHLPARLHQVSPREQWQGVASSGGAVEARDEAASAELLSGDFLPSLEELQGRYVRYVLERVGGNKRRAAALLGIGRRTLYRWLATGD